MKLVKWAALAAIVVALACKGTGYVRAEAPMIGVEAGWGPNPEDDEEVEGDESVYTATGKAVELARGEDYKAVFYDLEGKKVGEHTGVVPESGALKIPCPDSSWTVDWATGDDMESLDFQLPVFVYRMQPQGVFHVIRSTVAPESDQVMQFGMTMMASSLDDALERANEIALAAPLSPKPVDVVCHYFAKAVRTGAVVDVLLMTNKPQPYLWVDVNRSWQNEVSADVSQNGWNARAVPVPLSAFDLSGPGSSNAIRLTSGPVDVEVGFQASL